jgi:hypothetical protein
MKEKTMKIKKIKSTLLLLIVPCLVLLSACQLVDPYNTPNDDTFRTLSITEIKQAYEDSYQAYFGESSSNSNLALSPMQAFGGANIMPLATNVTGVDEYTGINYANFLNFSEVDSSLSNLFDALELNAKGGVQMILNTFTNSVFMNEQFNSAETFYQVDYRIDENDPDTQGVADVYLKAYENYFTLYMRDLTLSMPWAIKLTLSSIDLNFSSDFVMAMSFVQTASDITNFNNGMGFDFKIVFENGQKQSVSYSEFFTGSMASVVSVNFDNEIYYYAAGDGGSALSSLYSNHIDASNVKTADMAVDAQLENYFLARSESRINTATSWETSFTQENPIRLTINFNDDIVLTLGNYQLTSYTVNGEPQALNSISEQSMDVTAQGIDFGLGASPYTIAGNILTTNFGSGDVTAIVTTNSIAFTMNDGQDVSILIYSLVTM